MRKVSGLQGYNVGAENMSISTVIVKLVTNIIRDIDKISLKIKRLGLYGLTLLQYCNML